MTGFEIKNHERLSFPPLPLAGEGWGEGGYNINDLPLTSILSPKGRGSVFNVALHKKRADGLMPIGPS